MAQQTRLGIPAFARPPLASFSGKLAGVPIPKVVHIEEMQMQATIIDDIQVKLPRIEDGQGWRTIIDDWDYDA